MANRGHKLFEQKLEKNKSEKNGSKNEHFFDRMSAADVIVIIVTSAVA